MTIEILLPANLLTLSRLPLALVIYFLLASPGEQNTELALATLGLTALTDFLDGYFARRRIDRGAPPSRLGEALDPIADKILAAIVLIGLIQFREFPLWLAGIIVGRDLLILLAGSLILRRRSVVVRSNLPGKYYFASLALLLASSVAHFQYGVWLFTLLTLCLWIWSLFSYALVLRHLAGGQPGVARSDRVSRLGAALRLTATVAVGLLTLYHFWRENPLGW